MESIPVDTIVEEDLVAQVDEYFEVHENADDGVAEEASLLTIAKSKDSPR